MVEALFSPDLFIVGGGVSKKADKFLPPTHDVHTEIVPAQLLNEAGIVGAALAHASAPACPTPTDADCATPAAWPIGVRPAKPASGQCHQSMASSPSSQHSR